IPLFSSFLFFFCTLLLSPSSPLFPYTTLFRSILVPTRNHDLPFLSQPISLVPAFLFACMRPRRQLFCARRPRPKPRQASPIHRRRNHCLLFRSRRPHRLRHLSPPQDQTVRPRAR